MAVWVSLMDIPDSWKRKVIIVVVRDDNCVDDRYILDVTRRLGKAFGP
jgi:hypothetical protein